MKLTGFINEAAGLSFAEKDVFGALSRLADLRRGVMLNAATLSKISGLVGQQYTARLPGIFLSLANKKFLRLSQQEYEMIRTPDPDRSRYFTDNSTINPRKFHVKQQLRRGLCA